MDLECASSSDTQLACNVLRQKPGENLTAQNISWCSMPYHSGVGPEAHGKMPCVRVYEVVTVSRRPHKREDRLVKPECRISGTQGKQENIPPPRGHISIVNRACPACLFTYGLLHHAMSFSRTLVTGHAALDDHPDVEVLPLLMRRHCRLHIIWCRGSQDRAHKVGLVALALENVLVKQG